MSLSKQSIKEFQEIFKKEYDKELTYDEAADAGRNLVGLFQILLDGHVAELGLKKKLKDSPKSFALMDGKIYSCGICNKHIKDEQLWYNKLGKKCLACQDVINKKIIPGKIRHNDKYWYAAWEFDTYFKLKSATVRMLVRKGVLRVRVVPNPGFQVFLIKDNADVLPPKDIVNYVIVPVAGKEGMIAVTSWYKIKNPEETLQSYEIWPYLKAFKLSPKRESPQTTA